MMSEAKVSVVLPSYNPKKEWIEASIKSVISQTYKDLELIIIDDGSQPPIKDIIKDELLSLDKIKIFRQKNSGFTKAANTGIKKSSGEYIAHIADDDLWREDKLEIQVHYLEKGYDVVFSKSNWVNSRGKKIDEKKYPEPPNMISMLIEGGSIPTESLIWKKEVFEDWGLLDERLPIVSDLEFKLRVIPHIRAVCIDDTLITKRRHGDSLGLKADIEERKKVVKKYAKKLGIPKILKKDKLCSLYRRRGKWCLENNEPKKSKKLFLKSVAKRPNEIKSWVLLFSSFYSPIYKSILKKHSNRS